MAAAALAATLIATPAQATSVDYADVLARVTPDDPPAKRIDPWATERPQFRPVDGWARADVISPKHLAAIRHSEIVERAAERVAARPSAPTATYEPASPYDAPTYSVGPFAIPTYIVMCESGGNYLAENASSSASGAYQILDSTWAGFGGYSHAAYAPPAVQDEKAAQLWAGGAGASHWAACL